MRTVHCLACSAALVLAACAPMRIRAQLFEMNHGHIPGVKLTSQEESTIERLESLDVLPSAQWRYHQGDVPHGEQPSLDDSSWQQVEAHGDRNHRLTAPKEAVWFRREIEVPQTLNGYDLTGARVWFRFRANANGPVPEIIYFNGRRVALGDDLEPIVLFDDAKPGEKVLIAVKLLPTVDEKRIAGVDLNLEFPTNRPNPSDLRTEFLTAALLIPSISKDVSADEATLAKAIGDVDVAALDKKDQEKFDASLKQAQQSLEPLKPTLQQADMHLTGNSHIDAAWLWPWTETVDVVKRTFGTAAQLMNEYPTYTYTQSAAQYNQWMADKYPELNDEIKKRIQEGRWELVGGMWVEPDLNMPDRRIAGAADPRRAGDVPEALRDDDAHRLEPGFVRLQLATAADLQALRHRLFRNAEDDMERYQPVAVEALLVGVAGRQQGADLLPARLCATAT